MPNTLFRRSVSLQNIESHMSSRILQARWILQLIGKIVIIPRDRILQFHGQSQTVFAINKYAIYHVLYRTCLSLNAGRVPSAGSQANQVHLHEHAPCSYFSRALKFIALRSKRNDYTL